MPGLLTNYEWLISYSPADTPLEKFYIPALQRSVHYDRSAGFFSSSALAIAAAGVAELVKNGGTMRLLVGAEMSATDVEAIERGAALEELVTEKLLTALEAPMGELMQRRVEVLAWMVANGTLQIKVVLPQDQYGRPLPNSPDYYHPKEGIFTDAEGNQVGFNGSVNESMTAWQRNYESFMVFQSWDEGQQPYLRQITRRFEVVWEDRDPGWLGFPIPEAARRKLIQYAPSSAPTYDPVANPEPDEELERTLAKERVLFQFLRDAPHLIGNMTLGMETAAVTPWPHQVEVSQEVIRTYPRSYLLCDEVGLGKTIEAGLVLRQLLLSGLVKRCLLLVPKSVQRQWQEELYEKFVLDVPIFDQGKFFTYAGDELPYGPENPWDAFDVFIASSQLAKRRDRQDEVLAARPWDLILVDEAHHARRKDFLQPTYRPNRLLELLNHMKLRSRTMLLMTATPMQVHPAEVWDLLDVLGVLAGKWGAWDADFLSFYEQLMQPADQVDWDFVFAMVRDYLQHGGELDRELEEKARSALGPVDWEKIRNLPNDTRPTQTVKRLSKKAQQYVSEMARRHTPLNDAMFRNTRDLLRDYARRGLLTENVPSREPQQLWIPMRPEEMELYRRIEEYISEFYNKYEQRRKGLGFIMTVYRRRLTSSFYAIRESLERRLEYLRGHIALDDTLSDDDIEQEDLASDVTEDMLDAEGREYFEDEITYVEDFISALQALAIHDSKTEQLLQDLSEVFRWRETVIVFTQYTDTMDYLREKLRLTYGSQVACYSGRGGEKWNGIAWVTVTKEQIKQEFKEGENVKILLCTEAASEGLNLQTCGVLINYDMPWNPMRVEQRIGRIDRIGQVYEKVWIRNYFYEGTIEARIYQALSGRIQWFENVVGQLQPILAEVGRAIQRLAMVSPREQEHELSVAVRDIEQRIEQQDRADGIGIYGTYAATPVQGTESPVSLQDLEHFLTNSIHLRRRFHPHTEIEGAHLLDFDGKRIEVTFDPALFDAYPNTLHLLSYGSDILADLLKEVDLDGGPPLGLARVCAEPGPMVGYYRLDGDAQLVRVASFTELVETLEHNGLGRAWSEAEQRQAENDLARELKQSQQRLHAIAEWRYKGEEAALAEQARLLLHEAAIIETLQHSQEGGLDSLTGLSEQSVLSLERQGRPYKHLLRLAQGVVGRPQTDNPNYADLLNASPEQLSRRSSYLKNEGERILSQWQAVYQRYKEWSEGDGETTARCRCL